MVDLTIESFDDNATVRVVTLVTLIYLPASFVSVSQFRGVRTLTALPNDMCRHFWG
jgi:hypothetical protein